MRKIIFSENTFRTFKKCLVNEIIIPKGVTFCTSQKHELTYQQRLKDLDKVSNLRTNRYKNYELEEVYQKWAENGFSKDSEEYRIWCGHLKSYIDYIATSIDFVKGKIKRNGNTAPYLAFIDPQWVTAMINGGDDFQGIYCLTLKSYQNEVIWNDLFFNPIFENLKNDIKVIRSFATKTKLMDKKYELLLPLEEYNAIGKFMSNASNAKPELFYEEPKNGDDSPNNIPIADVEDWS